MEKMIQNNIEAVLSKHAVVPVVTIHREDEIPGIVTTLLQNNIQCIEVTLRTDYALEGIAYFKKHYGDQFSVGVGTVVKAKQVEQVAEIGVDFIVSPGINMHLGDVLEESNIPFIPGVATPSEIISGMQRDWNVFKFFPANLFGGLPALKAYGQVFPTVKFCPTGGITAATYTEYLALTNVISVGGSWMMK
jgi:2-dehydro-3-deoxyphosphogluconate aldolase / (4S)-4-hydroxy-2-oxoglutarate aldolase